MTEIGQFVDVSQIVREAGVQSAMGMQCGILVNDKCNEKERVTILIQHLGENQGYPNYWDKNCIGLLHYCGTNKGQLKKYDKQNLDARLNKAVNQGTYPIHVYVRYPDKKYRYMGEFIRLPNYDEEIQFNGKTIYRFGLISKNIAEVEPFIKEILNRDN